LVEVQANRRVAGGDRDRTGDLIVANDALSQLSYAPSHAPMKSMNYTSANLLKRLLYQSITTVIPRGR
jgi:hypothetical protein